MADKARKLYDALTAKGVSLGDYTLYSEKIKDSNNRKKLFDVATSNSIPVGDFERFERELTDYEPTDAQRAAMNPNWAKDRPLALPAVATTPSFGEVLQAPFSELVKTNLPKTSMNPMTNVGLWGARTLAGIADAPFTIPTMLAGGAKKYSEATQAPDAGTAALEALQGMGQMGFGVASMLNPQLGMGLTKFMAGTNAIGETPYIGEGLKKGIEAVSNPTTSMFQPETRAGQAGAGVIDMALQAALLAKGKNVTSGTQKLLGRGAQRLEGAAQKPPYSKAKGIAQFDREIATTLNENLSPSRGGLRKVDDILTKLDTESEGIRQQAMQQGATVDFNGFQRYLDMAIKKTKNEADAKEKVAGLNDMKLRVQGMIDQYPNGQIPLDAAWTFKKTLQDMVGGKYDEIAGYNKEAAKVAAHGLLDDIVANFPALREIGLRQRDLIEAESMISSRVAGGVKSPLFSLTDARTLGRVAAGSTGYVYGGVPGAIAGIAGEMLIESPYVQHKLAVTMDRLSKLGKSKQNPYSGYNATPFPSAGGGNPNNPQVPPPINIGGNPNQWQTPPQNPQGTQGNPYGTRVNAQWQTVPSGNLPNTKQPIGMLPPPQKLLPQSGESFRGGQPPTGSTPLPETPKKIPPKPSAPSPKVQKKGITPKVKIAEPKKNVDPMNENVLSNMPGDIQTMIKEYAQSLLTEAKEASHEVAGTYRSQYVGFGSNQEWFPDVKTIKGYNVSTYPEWMQWLGISKKDAIANLEKIIVDDPKNVKAQKLVEVIKSHLYHGRDARFGNTGERYFVPENPNFVKLSEERNAPTPEYREPYKVEAEAGNPDYLNQLEQRSEPIRFDKTDAGQQGNMFAGRGDAGYQAKMPTPKAFRETKGTEGTPLFQKEQKPSGQTNLEVSENILSVGIPRNITGKTHQGNWAVEYEVPSSLGRTGKQTNTKYFWRKQDAIKWIESINKNKPTSSFLPPVQRRVYA